MPEGLFLATQTSCLTWSFSKSRIGRKEGIRPSCSARVLPICHILPMLHTIHSLEFVICPMTTRRRLRKSAHTSCLPWRLVPHWHDLKDIQRHTALSAFVRTSWRFWICLLNISVGAGPLPGTRQRDRRPTHLYPRNYRPQNNLQNLSCATF